MEQFALAQMEAGHMDDNLAILYQEILPVSILNEELAHKAAEVLFVHKLCCTWSMIRKKQIFWRKN